MGTHDPTGACGGGDGNAGTTECQRANLRVLLHTGMLCRCPLQKGQKGKVEVSFQERVRFLIKI